MMMYRFHDILEKNSAIRLHAMPPKPILAVGACTHVVFSTFKSTKAGLRSQIESNTRSNLEGMSKRVYTIWFDDDDVEKNVHGTPVLRSMYTQAFSQFPDADTYTYVNGDLLMDGDFVRTADAVVSASKGGHLSRRFLVVGKRTNVDWRGKTTMEDFDAHHSEGTLFWNNAQDYFMVSKQTFDWEKAIPAFVVGRAGYDNWLVDTAFHDPEVALMDATPTIRVIHQTDHEGNVAQGGPNRPDKSYNHELGKGEWDHGTTDHAEYETFWKTDGTVGVRDRKGLSDIGGMTHDMVNVLNLASTRENPRTTACTHIVTDSGAGLFSNMMGVLAAMAKYGTNIQVQWKNTMYLAPNSENVWTQYFEPVSDCVVDALTKTIRMSGWDHGFADPEAALAPMAQRIRLNSDTQTEFNKSWTWRGQASLGVHIRSTDRATDGEGIKQHLLVVPTQRYVQHIQRYLDEHANTKTIFVASDSQESLDALVQTFGGKIRALDVVQSTDTLSIHHGGLDAPFATGKSAVLDAWLLATTDFKLLSASQLSLTAVLKQGIHTPFFLLNEEDGYQRIRTMFPSRPDNVVGAFPDRSRVSTPPAGTQMGHEQMAAIRDALGPNGNLLVWGLGNDSPFWNDATTGRVAFLEDDIPEAKAGTLWYDVITRKYPFLEAYKVHYHTDTVESFQQYIDSPDRWHELRLNDLPDSIRGENWDVIVVDAPLGCCNTGPVRYQSIYESWRMATNHTHVFVDDYERKVEREFSQAVFGRAPDSVVRRTKAASNANEQAHFGPPFAPRSSTPTWTILLTVNDGYYDFFQNWWAHFDRLNLPQKVVVVAEDDVVFAKLKTNYQITVERSHLTQSAAHAYDAIEYKKMVSTRAQHILHHLREGEDVLYTDVDTVWLLDPTDYLNQHADLVAQLDGTDYYCTGFMGIRSNARSIQFVEHWGTELAQRPQLNQPIFNHVLRHTDGLQHIALSDALFPNGKQYFETMDKNKKQAVVVVHNNYIIGHYAKKKRFQDNGLWHNFKP